MAGSFGMGMVVISSTIAVGPIAQTLSEDGKPAARAARRCPHAFPRFGDISRGGWKRQGPAGKEEAAILRGLDWNAMMAERTPFCHSLDADCASLLLPPSSRLPEALICSVYRKNDVAMKARCGLLVLAVVSRRADRCRRQNLDRETGTKLFAESCASCHRSRAARQGPLSPHALSVSAKTLFQRFELGLGADVLSGIRRQRKGASAAKPKAAGRRGHHCGRRRRCRAR